MPELPDIEAYRAAMTSRLVGDPLERIRVLSPFLLRSIDPPIEAAEGRLVRDVRRLGKRIVLRLDDELFLVFHLMIAGRFRWQSRAAKPPARISLATLAFPAGLLVLTEAGTKKRASLHLVRGESALAAHDPGGLDPLSIPLADFAALLRRGNHTLKRTLTDPRASQE